MSAMERKDVSLECIDCESTYLVTPSRAARAECPNCHGANVTLLDELPEEL